jgi:hypothetical protein
MLTERRDHVDKMEELRDTQWDLSLTVPLKRVLSVVH